MHRLGTVPRMRNPLQVYKDQLPVWIHHVQDGLELWVHLSLLHYWQVVPQGSQTGLELLMIQLTRLVLVKVPVWTKSCLLLQTFHPQTSNETTSICKYWGNSYIIYVSYFFIGLNDFLYLLEHHGEFSESILGYTTTVPGLDLLLQIVLHPHS